jgi:long-chain acyl-CoA synthetase
MNVAAITSGAQLADTTVAQLLAARLAERPDKIALQQKRHSVWTAMTWGAYAQRVVNLASALRRAGLERGDRVAIMGDSSEEWLIADMATMCAGGVMVGVYFTSSPEEVAYCFTDSGAKFAFGGGEPQLRIVLASGRAEQLRGIIVLDPDWTGEASASIKSLADFVGAHDVDAHDYLQKESATAKASDVVSIGYTSGTTGNPKGAMLTHLSILAGVHCITLFGPSMREEEHRVVVHLPMSHTVARGQATTLPLIADAVPYFGETTADFAQTIKEVKPTYYMAPPRFYQRFATQILSKVHPAGSAGDQNYTLAMTIARRALEDRQGGHEDAFVSKLFAACREQVFLPLLAEVGFDELKVAFTSSAAMPSELMSLWQLWGLQLKECYGQTELVGANLVQMAGWPKAGNVGVPLPDPAWETAVLQDGEMIVRGPGLFAGYWNKPDETKAALRDGWLYTGDIGFIDSDGFLRVTDRKKDLIVTSGGKNVPPQKIENLAKAHPMISQFFVFGDRRNYLTALVTLDPARVKQYAEDHQILYSGYPELLKNPKIQVAAQRMIDEVNSKLASFETIKKFIILPREFSVEEGEMTPSLKLKRKVIQERYRDALESMYAQAATAS